uniref:Si:ch211-13k12.2 n=1 Tax=Cyprinus carpio TaxID=7962 RepID=A0A8C2HHL6_CYPCA
MAALKQEHRYGLSCGKINKSIPNKTIFHVKLTDTAIRTLEAYKNLKVTHLCIKGVGRQLAGYLLQYISCNPGSFEICASKYVSATPEHLESQGSIQDKITVCATDDSYQMTRESV